MASLNDILAQRAATHGNYAEQAWVAQFIKQLLRASPRWRDLSLPQMESVEMIAMKLSRIVHGNPDEPDHWQDIAGYAQLIVRELEDEQGS